MDTGFSIEDNKLQCPKCNSLHSLDRKGQPYDHCKCYNIRILRLRNYIDIVLFEEKKNFEYEYTD